ncbi:nuclear transport factor 2 family protein [Actinokineospora sp. NPDC004072]
MSDLKELVDRYIQLWNTTDADTRGALATDLCTADAVFVDPFMEVQGPDAINAGIGAVVGQFPGHALTLIGPVDAHHGTARFRWQIAPTAGGDSIVEGSDVVVADEGKLKGIYGFIDKMPAA